MGGWSLFGSAAGPTGWMRDQSRQNYGAYGTALANSFGPEAFQRSVSGYSEDMDNALAGQGAAQYGNLAARGFSPSTTNLFGTARATGLAKFKARTRADMNQGMLSGLGEQAGILRGMQGIETNPGTQGVFGTVMQGLGTAGGLGWTPLGQGKKQQ